MTGLDTVGIVAVCLNGTQFFASRADNIAIVFRVLHKADDIAACVVGIVKGDGDFS